MKSIIGKVRFLSVKEGGQSKLPKEMLSTPIIFKDDIDQEFGLWSMNMYLITDFDENREAIVRFEFLFNNSSEAPHQLLYVGSKFNLITNRVMANCIVTNIVDEEEGEWFCPAVERVISEGLCWEYCFANNGGPTDTAQELDLWIRNTKKYKSIEEFQMVCDKCKHCQWSR
ncbi:hypothetical protein [Paenibacillus sp. R14(2021)]|uniref:hypothetical protein n=1 Tax=Paenibacillus sp. R14(2021) TaxID=2859228 RepID=UPI001C61508F|nr:hypothetical protein [Paenibacillus sp. R14(2021)]